MGANDDVDFSLLQVLQCILSLTRRFEPVDIIHLDREILQPVGEGLVMLKSKNGSRHQYYGLLAVATALECSTDCNLGLAKPNVTAYQAVHRRIILHVFL